MRNLERLLELRWILSSVSNQQQCTITLQLTYLEKLLPEIPDIISLAITLGIDRVKGHHLWVHSEQLAHENLRRNAESIAKWNRVAQCCRSLAKSTLLPNGKHLVLENFDDLPLPSQANTSQSDVQPDHVCPFLGREAWINAEGRFDPCCAPDEQRRTLGSFGKVNDVGNSLLKIWHSDTYKYLVREYLLHPLCRSCGMRKVMQSQHQQDSL